jgi:hypothetical protein
VAAAKTLTASQRRLRASIAAHAMHAAHDPRETTKAGTAAFLARFEAQVDPSITDPAERQRRAEHLRRQYMQQLAFKSSRARQAAQKAGGAAD